MSTQEIVKGKRGRKSKKELMASLGMTETTIAPITSVIEKTVISSILEPLEKHISLSVSEIIPENTNNINDNAMNINEIIDDEEDETETETPVKPVKQALKKRGRKPKGGKIIQQSLILDSPKNDKPNVILHLKCSMKDLHNSNGSCNSDSTIVESYTFSKNNNLCYDVIGSENINSVTSNDKSKNTINALNTLSSMNSIISNNDKYINDDNEYDYEESNNNIKETTTKELWKKLKQLEHNLHINNVNNKKSACFWDTCEFDNPPVYIPKHYISGTYHVYGCFCSPECGVAYLMNENIDSSTKFERYHLFNHIYSKMYDYKKNIKPAPNPYYMLEKYYGNLSIQEYRSLLRNERLFLIVDKPLTRILPELHDDNDDFILNNKIIPSNNNYQLKSRMQRKKPSKNSILNEKFGGTSTATTSEYE
jgi:hypothetical protein